MKGHWSQSLFGKTPHDHHDPARFEFQHGEKRLNAERRLGAQPRSHGVAHLDLQKRMFSDLSSPRSSGFFVSVAHQVLGHGLGLHGPDCGMIVNPSQMMPQFLGTFTPAASKVRHASGETRKTHSGGDGLKRLSVLGRRPDWSKCASDIPSVQ